MSHWLKFILIIYSLNSLKPIYLTGHTVINPDKPGTRKEKSFTDLWNKPSPQTLIHMWLYQITLLIYVVMLLKCVAGIKSRMSVYLQGLLVVFVLYWIELLLCILHKYGHLVNNSSCGLWTDGMDINSCFSCQKATEEFKQLTRPKPSQRGLMRYSWLTNRYNWALNSA